MTKMEKPTDPVSTTKKPTWEDWTPSVTRLRVEMVVTSVLMLAATRLSGGLGEFSVFGVQVGQVSSNGQLTLFILLFWLYFAGAFVLRIIVETRQTAFPHDTLQILSERLRLASSELRGIGLAIVGERGFDLAVFSKALEHHATQTRGLLDLRMHLERTLISEVEGAHGSFIGGLSSMNSPHDEGGLPRGHELEDFLSSDLSPADQRAYFKRVISDTVSRTNSMLEGLESVKQEFIRESDLVLREQEVTLTESQAAAITQLKQLEARIEDTVSNKGDELTKVVDEARRSIDAVLKIIRRFQGSVRLEKLVVSCIIPLLFSCSLVVLSAPQAISDIAPELARMTSCLDSIIHGDLACMMRSGPLPTLP